MDIAKLLSTAFSVIFSIFTVIPLYGQNPFIPKYDAVKRSERCFTVTWEQNNQFGAVWWADKVDFSSDTLFNFVVYMGDRDGNGADGLAFVMHQDPRDTITDQSQQVTIGGAGTWDLEAATGDDGGGLGFSMHQSRVGPNTIPGPHGPGDSPENHKIQPSVAIELDTWNNTDVPDGRQGTDGNGINQPLSPYYGWDHTAVIYNGDLYGGQQIIEDGQGNTGRILPLKPSYAFGSGNNPDGSPYHNIEDDRCYTFQVRWDVNTDGTQTLQLWADIYNGTTNTNNLQLIMTHTDDMINNVFGGDPVMRFGFTGSTGGSINEQTICLLGENLKPFAADDYASVPMNQTTVIDVETNDNDPDGDQLHVPIIIKPAKNGQALIFDSLDVNYMRYTPNTGYVGLDTIGYVTCDVNSTKCYAKCDTAFVYIDVGCIPFDVDLTAISPNLVCTDSVPANGIASANVDATFIRGTHWYEGFEDSYAHQTEDSGPTAWTSYKEGSNCSPGNNLYAQNFEFRTKVVTGTDCELVFETEEIDISTVSDVCISIDFRTSNAVYESNDYIESYYILDGGQETMFNVNGRLDGTFGMKTASTCGLNGSSFKIVVRTKSNHSSEEYYWDNIHVTAVGAGVPDVTYNWYQGGTPSGSIIYTGAINNTLNHGTYTVVAIDNLTGCPSNPATITIDSAGTRVPGGYIKQVSPFTNCELPYDGVLEAGVIEGTDSVNLGYMFQWYIQEDPTDIIQTGYVAGGLTAREYTVQIIDLSTGCDTTLSAEVPNAVVLPVVTATKLADITSCTDPNTGIGEANVGGITDGYRFEWYIGPAIGGGPPNYTGGTVNTFPLGIYTVQAIDSATYCPSDPVSITVNDLTANPVPIVTVDSEQISCDTLSPTGQLSGAVDVSGTPTTTGYTFNWYKGPNDIIPARQGYTGGPVANRLEAGTYRLVVVEDASNCTAFIDTLVQDMTVNPPDITVTPTDVTYCSSPNGIITVNVVGNPADYTYEVYVGNGIIPDSLLVTSNSNIIQNLPTGNYTVIAKDNITECATNPSYATINDATVLPSAAIISQDQISCDPNNPTGQLTANMGLGVISDYTYEWFEDNLAGAPISPSSIDGEEISNLDSGDYVVRIINNTTLCENVYYTSVSTAIVLPLEAVSSNPSTFCGSAANGQLIATVDGGLTEADGYTFIWGSQNTNDTLSATTATVNQVEPGDYILTVIKNATACASNPAPVIVDDNTVIPDPVITVLDNSSCDLINPNGEIRVTGINNELNPLSDYYYGWYDGNSSGSQLVSPNISFSLDPDSSQIAGLDAMTVALVITNSVTSCSNEVLSIINDINIKPIIDAVVPDHVENCVDPFNSGASIVSVNGGQPVPAGYTFTWTNLDGGPAITGKGSSILDYDLTDETLPPGNYMVTAYNEYNCPSDPVTFILQDNSTDPIFSVNGYNNITCDPGLPVGSLVALRPAGSSYAIAQYEWFLNSTSGTLISSTTPNDSILYNQSGGIYAVRITEASTGCSSVEYATIQDSPASNPNIQNISISNSTRCDIVNGELGYQVFPYELLPPFNLGTRTYTFNLSNGTDSYNLNTAGISDNVIFTGLGPGNWGAYVVDDFTHCQSTIITNTLTSASEIIITTTINKNPASCVGSDGEAMITVESVDGTNKDPIGPGFDINWYEGIDFTTPFASNLTSNTTIWAQEANNLRSTYYTVNVLDRNTQCEKDTTFFVSPDVTPIFLAVNTTDATQCFPGNGTLTAVIDPTTFGFGKDYSDYDYIMFEGMYADLTWAGPGNGEYKVIDGATVVDPINGPVDFGADIEPGRYVIIAQEKDPTKCFGEPFILEIGLDFEFPAFAFNITPDKSCVGGTGTGQIIENAAQLAGNINYSWHTGIDASSGSISNTNATPVNSYADSYYLTSTVINNIPNTSNGGTTPGGLGCEQDSITIIPKIPDNLQLAATGTDNTNCAPFYDGEVIINNVVENGINVGFPAEYGDFTILDTSINPYVAAVGDGTTTPWGQIEPGNYYLQARQTVTNCFTDYYQMQIDNLAENPEISIALNNPDYACDPTLADGELEATASGSQDILAYNFTWFQGNTGGPIVSNNPIASNITANSSTQLYTIEVEDIAGVNQGCISTKAYTLVHQPTTVSILRPDITKTDQTICGANASIVVDRIFEDDGGGPIGTNPDYSGIYNAQLLDHNLNVIDPIVNGYASFNPVNGQFGTNNIPAATYYVQASNIATGCAFGPVTQVIVRDVSKNPLVAVVLTNPDYACTGGVNTGILTPTVFGGTDNDTYPNLVVSWYYKGTAISPLTDNGGGAYPDRAIDLAAGVYTIEVTDIAGADQNCITTRDFLVPAARNNIDIIASGTDQNICIPDGTIQIDDVLVNTVSVSNPHVNWTGILLNALGNPVTPVPVETGFASNADPFANLSSGIYYTRAQDNLTKCYSDPFQVRISDLSEDPVIDITVTSPQYSLNPNPASWTGAMQASVTEVDGMIGTYNYNWHRGIGVMNPSISTADNVNMKDRGLYTFVAENTNTGCASQYYIYLPFVYLEPLFNTSITPLTICLPFNGGIEVTDITLDGNPDQLSDYNFNFHHNQYNNGDIPDATVPGSNGGTYYHNINAGSYYIIAMENWWWIKSYPVKVDVLDSTTNPIISFDVTDYHAMTSCDETVFADGSLGIEVYEDPSNPYLNPPFNYGYTWYTGSIVNPAFEIAGETNNIISGLPAGDYTVQVVNLDNNCQAENTYSIEDESVTPIVVGAQTPNTNCLIEIANGIATAHVINSNNPYFYQWYQGIETLTTPDYQGATWTGRPSGYYTVVAIDQGMGTCISSPVVIEVENAIKPPVVLINEISPVTNCDPERTNGVLSAVTQKGREGHTFEWFLDGNLYATGPIASDLGLFDYELVVTDNVTKCQTTMISGPTQLISIVPPPDVDILGDRTSCLEPDGMATATVNGNVVDYIFRYYNKFSGEELTNLYEDYTIYDLDTSTYLVTAESRKTGCVSEPTAFAIANDSYFPEIDVIADPSNCLEPSGSANVIISDMTRDFRVTWYGDNGFEAQEKEIVYIPAGNYRVEVEGTDGCISSTEAEVKADIIIYNGVSANHDGLNDYFAVICLEYFLENNVKIYNRAGLLVYEQDFYDMNDPSRRFEGISNKGASVIGTELPIGTYFYVVDKNDGSKAKVGYLELNR